MWSVRRILCPVDYSEASVAALNLASEWAQQFGAELRVLHVISQYPAEMMDYGAPIMVSIPTEYERRGADEKVLLNFLHEHVSAAVQVEHEVVLGAPSNEIVEVAKNRQSDVIIMGTHGHSGWRHFILGSVTEAVLKNSPCPVLTIGPGVAAPKVEAAEKFEEILM